MTKLELLSPAKDTTTAIAAITCGADAVYIGPSKFGARQAVGNTINDIAKTIDYAHQYHAKVYATINTILQDDEIAPAQQLIDKLYNIGIDGIIIQDVGLLELDLPPVPIIASTQMNIDAPDKAEFFASIGLKRLILPRELSIDQIAAIRQSCDIELEAFIHGALCVGRSGQCYMSYSIGSRSGNRGECAQPCRKIYRLEDKHGNIIHPNAHLLSIMDLNRGDYLEQIIDAGVTSFKIEGRLKNIPYVANITAHYRQLIDEIIQRKNQSEQKYSKTSTGTIELNFDPDPTRSFNRGFTSYNITGKQEKIGSIATPKSIGQPIGKITGLHNNSFELDSNIQLNNADGICFFDSDSNLSGTVINRVEGKKIFPADMTNLYVGCMIHRNNDHKFNQLLNKVPAQRNILIDLELTETQTGLLLSAIDEDGITAAAELPCTKEPARNVDTATANMQSNLTKFGNTIFECGNLKISLEQMYFVPAALLNQLRRELTENLLHQRSINRPTEKAAINNNDHPYPQTTLNFNANVLNNRARDFYTRHGVTNIRPAAETCIDLTDKIVMQTRYCIRKQLDLCRPRNAEDLYLIDEDNNRFRITFDCHDCGMKITKE